MLVLLSLASTQDLVPDKAIEIELKTADSVIEGHGASRTFEYDVTFDGTLYIWAASNELDPILRVTSAEGEVLANDDNSGGGTTAYIALEVSRNELPSITVAASETETAGKVLLHVSETLAGDADLAISRRRIDESNAARDADYYESARAIASEVIADLLSPWCPRRTRA